MTDLYKEREEFESDLADHLIERDASGLYINNTTQIYWEKHLLKVQIKELKAELEKAKAQAVPETHTLVSNDKLHEWYCMAIRSEELGCPECYEARGYVHNLACELNEASESGAEG